MPHSMRGSGKREETQSVWAEWKKTAKEYHFPFEDMACSNSPRFNNNSSLTYPGQPN